MGVDDMNEILIIATVVTLVTSLVVQIIRHATKKRYIPVVANLVGSGHGLAVYLKEQKSD